MTIIYWVLQTISAYVFAADWSCPVFARFFGIKAAIFAQANTLPPNGVSRKHSYSIALQSRWFSLDAFPTFNDFFSRKLMDGARPISSVPRGLVSPVDGSITSLGRITEDADRVEQVTGVNYDKVSQPDFKS